MSENQRLAKIRCLSGAKYACRACESGVTQAPAPARLIENGMVSTALVAQIAVAKYAWLSTLYRQTLILSGQGVVLDRQTLARWMKQAAWMLEGLYELQLATMHRCPRLFCDETPMPVLAPGHVKTSQFWAHATDDRAWAGPAPPAVAYVFAGSRGKKVSAVPLPCWFEPRDSLQSFATRHCIPLAQSFANDWSVLG